MKVKVYIMHSEKVNYKEDIYKPLLERGLMNDFFLILPMTEKFKAEYVKELIGDSDIVICDLTKFNFFSNIELKVAKKLNKDIRYFVRSDDKNKSKYKDINIIEYNNSLEYVGYVENILKSLNQKEILLRRENIYCLGKIVK